MKFIATCIVAILIAGFGSCNKAHAQNLNFTSSGLTGWTLSTGGSQSPSGYSSAGVGASIVTSISGFNDGGYTWNINPYSGYYMASLQPGYSSPSYSAMTSAFGLNTTSINGIQSFLNSNSGGGATNPTNAAYMYYSGLSLNAGTNFTVAWNFVATDYVPWNDTSIATLVATSGGGLATINNITGQYAVLGAINPGSGNYSTNSYGSTGWELATFQVNATGVYTLGFGSFNLGDTVNSPILLVSGVTGTTYNGTTPVQPVAPNQGSSAPVTTSGPTVVSTANSVTTTTTNNADGSVSTYSQPVIVTTYSDGSQTTANNGSATLISTATTTTAGGGITQAQQTTVNIVTARIANQSNLNSNSIYINQSGNGDNITITQVGSGNKIDGATLTSGVSGFTTSAPITGGSNHITTRQHSNNNLIDLASVGGSNTLNLNQGTDANGNYTGLDQGGHYQYDYVNGLGNNLTVVQENTSTTGNQFSSVAITGNLNTVGITQTGNARNQLFASVTGNSNTISTSQTGTSAGYISVTAQGNGNSATVIQSNAGASGANSATISLINSGAPASVNLNQTGGQTYNISQTCYTTCGTVTVKQGN